MYKVLQPCTLIPKNVFFILIASYNVYCFVASSFFCSDFYYLQIFYLTIIFYGGTEIKHTDIDTELQKKVYKFKCRAFFNRTLCFGTNQRQILSEELGHRTGSDFFRLHNMDFVQLLLW